MRLIFIGLTDLAKNNNQSATQNEIDRQIIENLWQQYENRQMLAFASWLLKNTRINPLFILERGDSHVKELKDLHLEYFETGSNMLDPFRFWRWQKKIAALQILFFGRGSRKLARSLAKKRSVPINALYYAEEEVAAANLTGSKNYLCASNLVVKKITEAIRDMKTEFVDSATRLFLPGIDWQAFGQMTAWKLTEPQKHFVFGMAESLLPRSGALDVVRAMSAFWQRNDLPPWEVRLFGDGPRLTEILSEAETLGVASRLSILSAQELENVAQYCHCWLAPGDSPNETPECLWAGLAAGLPIICTDTPLHREWLPWEPEPAIFVNCRNPQDLAGAMIKIIKNQDLRADLCAKAKICREDLGMDKMSDRLWTILKKLLSLD